MNWLTFLEFPCFGSISNVGTILKWIWIIYRINGAPSDQMSLWVSNILFFAMGSFILFNISIFLVQNSNIFQHLVWTKMTMPWSFLKNKFLVLQKVLYLIPKQLHFQLCVIIAFFIKKLRDVLQEREVASFNKLWTIFNDFEVSLIIFIYFIPLWSILNSLEKFS